MRAFILAVLCALFVSDAQAQSALNPLLFQQPRNQGYEAPSPPSPMPIPRMHEQNPYGPQKPRTWGEHPCANAVPPYMRDQPTTNMHPSIPPACR